MVAQASERASPGRDHLHRCGIVREDSRGPTSEDLLERRVRPWNGERRPRATDGLGPCLGERALERREPPGGGGVRDARELESEARRRIVEIVEPNTRIIRSSQDVCAAVGARRRLAAPPSSGGRRWGCAHRGPRALRARSSARVSPWLAPLLARVAGAGGARRTGGSTTGGGHSSRRYQTRAASTSSKFGRPRPTFQRRRRRANVSSEMPIAAATSPQLVSGRAEGMVSARPGPISPASIAVPTEVLRASERRACTIAATSARRRASRGTTSTASSAGST